MSTMSDRPDKPLIMLPGPIPRTPGNEIAEERRATPRYPFTTSATVFDILTQTRVAGRCGDLSSGGCYIDTMSPFSVGTAVRVFMERGLEKFEAFGTVIYAPQSMGMGLAFNEIKPEHQAVLQNWISELSGEKSSEHEVVPEAGPETGTITGIVNLRQVLNELINLMVRRKIIGEKDGMELLRRMFQRNDGL
jgi:PilZ domain